MEDYNKFVTGEKDLIGKIAFAEYYKSLKAALEVIRESRGKEPTAREADMIRRGLSTPENINKYKNGTSRELIEYVAFTVYENEKNGNKLTRYFYGVSQSLVAAFLWTLLLAVVLYFYNPNFRKYMNATFTSGNAIQEFHESSQPHYSPQDTFPNIQD